VWVQLTTLEKQRGKRKLTCFVVTDGGLLEESVHLEEIFIGRRDGKLLDLLGSGVELGGRLFIFHSGHCEGEEGIPLDIDEDSEEEYRSSLYSSMYSFVLLFDDPPMGRLSR